MKSWIVAVFALPVLGIALHGAERAGENPGKTEVRASDIGVNADIIGLLGRPLGEMMTVTGIYDPDNRRNEGVVNLIRVTKVNGRELPVPVDIESQEYGLGTPSRFPAGEVLEWRGCELGGYRNFSNEFILEYRATGGSSFQQAQGFGFYTTFGIVKPPAPMGSSPVVVAPATAPEKSQIRTEDIGKSEIILGRLGVPVGSVATVTATYDPEFQTAFPAKVIRVTKVNGKELSAPVDIGAAVFLWDPPLELPLGKAFECRGSETGVYGPISPDFYREYLQAGGKSEPPKTAPGFHTSFQLIAYSIK
ncbi:MAG: hypothetical protein JWO82_1186 [Akkermansiaceae bacterium]|nr:hypothetical protein [Akkermansiaceae bacterium]